MQAVRQDIPYLLDLGAALASLPTKQVDAGCWLGFIWIMLPLTQGPPAMQGAVWYPLEAWESTAGSSMISRPGLDSVGERHMCMHKKSLNFRCLCVGVVTGGRSGGQRCQHRAHARWAT
jgi:hypothetical protein